MTFELMMLFWVAVTLMVLLMVQGAMTPVFQGLGWGLGPRDEPREQAVLQGRMGRVVANHMEGMAVFAVLVVVAHLAGISTSLTETGAALYLASRVLFAPAYLSGVPVVRSMVWSVSIVGIVLFAYAILTAPMGG